MINININIDHFATIRNARGENEPNILFVAQTAEIAGASGIVAHLRKDRRHIKDADVINIKNNISTHLNLEMSVDKEIVELACKIKPTVATIVPEEANELTTEGGLNIIKNKNIVENVIKKMQDAGIQVSLFIEPEEKQIELAAKIGANRIEFNTKYFAIACNKNDFNQIDNEIKRMLIACDIAIKNKLYIAAGHSLNYHNINIFAKIIEVQEYNIGHSIVARSTIIGLNNAVKEMLELIHKIKQINII